MYETRVTLAIVENTATNCAVDKEVGVEPEWLIDGSLAGI
jgi:hypothetical protein